MGPALPADARCPVCAGKLGRWGFYVHLVRRLGAPFRLRVRRALPPLPADPRALAELPLCAPARPRGGDRETAFRLAADGRGHRAAADALSVPETTARSWLRRLRRRADPLRARFAWLAAGLGQEPARAPPLNDPLL